MALKPITPKQFLHWTKQAAAGKAVPDQASIRHLVARATTIKESIAKLRRQIVEADQQTVSMRLEPELRALEKQWVAYKKECLRQTTGLKLPVIFRTDP